MRSAIVPIFRSWRFANSTRSGMRAIEPSGFMISQITAAGVSPASSARSHPASVWPARTSTPPFCAITGKIWPGCTMSSGFACLAVAARTVRARSAAEMPVLTPLAASMETVNAVPIGERLSFTMSARLSWRQRSSVSVRQTRPRACVARKLMASGVTKSAASTRSPSFSRSSASASTIMRPRRSSSISCWVGEMAMEMSLARPLFCPNSRADLSRDRRFLRAGARPAPRRLLSILFRTLQCALDVAREHVDLEVHVRAWRQGAQGRHCPRVRDEVHLEAQTLDAIDRKAYSIDRDRALARDEARERRGRLDHEPRASAQLFERDDFAHGIDVARDEMPVDALAEAQRLSQVHFTPRLEPVRDAECRARYIGLEPRAIEGDHREAHALHCDRIAERDV